MQGEKRNVSLYKPASKQSKWAQASLATAMFHIRAQMPFSGPTSLLSASAW